MLCDSSACFSSGFLLRCSVSFGGGVRAGLQWSGRSLSVGDFLGSSSTAGFIRTAHADTFGQFPRDMVLFGAETTPAFFQSLEATMLHCKSDFRVRKTLILNL